MNKNEEGWEEKIDGILQILEQESTRLDKLINSIDRDREVFERSQKYYQQLYEKTRENNLRMAKNESKFIFATSTLFMLAMLFFFLWYFQI